MKRVLMFFLVIILSVGGYYGWMVYLDKQSTSGSPSEANVGQQGDMISVDFDGEVFVPSTVNLKVGDYLGITNRSSTKLMSLTSTYYKMSPAKEVPYEYVFEVNFDETGKYLIINKDKPSKTLEVIVN